MVPSRCPWDLSSQIHLTHSGQTHFKNKKQKLDHVTSLLTPQWLQMVKSELCSMMSKVLHNRPSSLTSPSTRTAPSFTHLDHLSGVFTTFHLCSNYPTARCILPFYLTCASGKVSLPSRLISNITPSWESSQISTKREVITLFHCTPIVPYLYVYWSTYFIILQ